MPSRTTRDFELTSSGYNMNLDLPQISEEEIVIDARYVRELDTHELSIQCSITCKIGLCV